MKSIRLFTMVKDEVDIIEDWILYHGYIFGFNNLHIIDNYSTDGTYDILLKYQREKNIFLIRENDYRRKGEFMRHLIKDRINNNYDIAYPLDADEFIVLYQNGKIDINNLRVYLQQLPNNHSNYKTNYIQSTISSDNDIGYRRATIECQNGIYANYNNLAKTFFNNRKWNGQVDHGNHCPNQKYYMTDICLIHFHSRNLNQVKQKTINNVRGLGYDMNNLPQDKNLPGGHHVQRLRDIQENKFQLDTNYTKNDSSIDLREFNNFILNLHKIYL